MLSKSLFNIRNLTVVFAVLIASAGIYAFAAANTVPETGAGAGSGVVSGYTISNVTYTINGSNPTILDAVTFDVASTSGSAGTPTQVEARLDASTSTWYSCTAGAGSSWSCDTTGVSLNVEDIDTLEIVATE